VLEDFSTALLLCGPSGAVMLAWQQHQAPKAGNHFAPLPFASHDNEAARSAVARVDAAALAATTHHLLTHRHDTYPRSGL
jgi:hypothetical protein